MTTFIAQWNNPAARAPVLPKVLTHANISRISLQNTLVRQLKNMGVKVLTQEFNAQLTIRIDPASAATLLQHQTTTCVIKLSVDKLSQYSVFLQGCQVLWEEARP